MNVIFESKRINFVEISEDLIKEYLIMINDLENVDIFIGGYHDPYTEEQELNWVREKLNEKNNIYSLIEKETGEFIGNIEYMNLKDGAAELGIALTEKKQNQGFGTEAILALLKYGKETLGLKRVYLRTNLNNFRAIHVYEKCGFKEYGVKEDHRCMELYL